RPRACVGLGLAALAWVGEKPPRVGEPLLIRHGSGSSSPLAYPVYLEGGNPTTTYRRPRWEREDSNLRLPLLRVTIIQRPLWGKNGNGVFGCARPLHYVPDPNIADPILRALSTNLYGKGRDWETPSNPR